MNTNTVEEEVPQISETDTQSHPVIQALDARIDALFAATQNTDYWREMTLPQTSPTRIRSILRELFLSIHWYQPHTTEAGYLMLGKLPKNELRILKLLLLHKTEEAEHGIWALNDYLALGGNKEFAKTTPPDPSAFAVAAVWWRLAQVEDPWAYLGAEYLFEYLTVKVAQPMVEMFKRRGFGGDGLHFIIEHATEDVKHAILIRSLIVEAVTRYPHIEQSIYRGFDYFQHVYPLPVWDAAYKRAH